MCNKKGGGYLKQIVFISDASCIDNAYIDQ